jgi:hypothetical protein
MRENDAATVTVWLILPFCHFVIWSFGVFKLGMDPGPPNRKMTKWPNDQIAK